MAILTLEQMTTPMTPDEVKTSIYNVLALIGTKTTSWKPGAVARTIIAGLAIILASFTELMALIAKSGWLELCDGNWLKLVAVHVYGLTSADFEGTFAPGVMTVNNGAGGVFGPFAIGDVIFKNTASGKTYRNTAVFSIGALQTGIQVPIEALELGADSTSAPGAIDALVTTMIGVAVTNAAAVVGRDALSDPAIRTLCNEKRSALSPNGPRDAYSFFAKNAKRADGSSVGITRVAVSKNSTTGQVAVTVANDSGPVTGTADDPNTDLGAVDLAIKTNVVPIGPTETTQSATSFAIDVTYELWIYSTANLTSQQVQDLVVAKLTTFVSTQPIGGNVILSNPGKVFVDAIRTAIGATRPEIFHVLVTAPVGDDVLAATDVALLGIVTCTAIHQVVP